MPQWEMWFHRPIRAPGILFDSYHSGQEKQETPVDGQNPAPVEMIKTLQFVWYLHKQLVILSINCIKVDRKSFLLGRTLFMIILEFLTMQGVLILQLHWSTVVFISAFSGWESRSSWSHKGAVGTLPLLQWSKTLGFSVDQFHQTCRTWVNTWSLSRDAACCLGYVAATASSRLGSCSYSNLANWPTYTSEPFDYSTSGCKDLKRQKHLRPPRVSNQKVR